MSQDPSIRAKRIHTRASGQTTIGEAVYAGVPVEKGEASIVPAGCLRILEGPALNFSIRRFARGFFSDYHTCPVQTHQLILTLEGVAGCSCHDGTSFTVKAGDFVSAEDSVGPGHVTRDEAGEGFTLLFISRPANI